jgi:hypothetical protein
VKSIEAPVSEIMAVIIIIVTGLTLAFGDTAGGFRRLIRIVSGLPIAVSSSGLAGDLPHRFGEGIRFLIVVINTETYAHHTRRRRARCSH